MTWPAIFYYRQKSSEDKFSKNPPGTLDVGRLLNGKAAWRKQTPMDVEKKKKLFLTDFTYYHRTPEETDKIKDILRQLIADGFEIYDTLQAIPLTENQINSRLVFPPVYFSPEMVAESRNLPKEEICLLDDYLLTILSQPILLKKYLAGEKIPREIDIKNLGGVTRNSKGYEFHSPTFTDCVAALIKATPPLTVLKVTEFDARLSMVLSILHATFPSLEIRYELNKWNNEEDTCFSQQDAEKNKEILYQHLEMITTLCLKDDKAGGAYFKAGNIYRAVDYVGYLQKYEPALDCENTMHLRNLINIDIDNFHFDENDFLRLLYANSKLQVLTITDATVHPSPPGKTILQDASLPALRTIELDRSIVSICFLMKLIESATNLACIKFSPRGREQIIINQQAKEKIIAELRGLKEQGFDATPCPPFFQHMKEKLETSSNTTYKPNANFRTTSDSNMQSNVLDLPPPSTEATQPTHIAQETPFDENEFLRYKPTDKNFSFNYEGRNKTKNQAMLIEKLSRYFILTGQYVECIPKLNDGMCAALSKLFIKTSLFDWETMVADIAAWDGKLYSLTEDTTHALITLRDAFVQTYLIPSPSYTYFVGDELSSLLTFAADNNQSLLLNNPWHAISIKYLQTTHEWLVYDPECKTGYKTIKDFFAVQQYIISSLGSLVSAIDFKPHSPIIIQDKRKFIREGGLLSLLRASNKQEMIEHLPKPSDLQLEDMKGLLLRDLKGMPAWALGISDCLINNYVLDLLVFAFRLNNHFIAPLVKSIEVMTGMQKHACIEQLLSLGRQCEDREKITLINQIIDVMHKNSLAQRAEDLLATWNKAQPTYQSVDHYLLEIMNHHGKNRLIDVSSETTANAMQLALQRFCFNTSRPVYIVHSPEDFICSTTYMKREGDKGTAHKGPGGPLHDFLIANQDKAPLIIIMFDNFSNDEIVQFNTAYEKINRVADGTAVPKEAMIVGIQNSSKPGAYLGGDLYSRFHFNEQCPFTTEQLKQTVPAPLTTSASKESYVINLFHADDWEQRLLGKWLIKPDGTYFEEGELLAAIKSGKPLDLRNKPKDNPRFDFFMQQLHLNKPFKFSGVDINPHKEAIYLTSEGYDWSALVDNNSVQWSRDLSTHLEAKVLNPALLTPFYQRYEIDNDTQSLNTLPGLFREYAGKVLHINITHALSADLWAMVLDECKKYNVQAHFHCSPDVILTDELLALLPDMKNTKAPVTHPVDFTQAVPHTAVIKSTDPDVTIEMIREKEPDWEVIDVSELTISDLLKIIDADFTKESFKFTFTERECALSLAKKQNKKIILTGHISLQLAQSLTEELLARGNLKDISSKLLIITDNNSHFGFMPSNTHDVTIKEKRGCFEKYAGETTLSTLPENESYTQWCARVRYKKSHPQCTDESLAWEGVKTISADSVLGEFDTAHSTEKAYQFEQERIDEYNNISKHSPIIVLTGLTGVGKTSFVKDVLKEKQHAMLFEGIAQLEESLKAAENSPVILFLDEANAAHSHWSILEGLMRHPPGVLIKGEYKKLTENQAKNLRAVLAMNPLSYGAERKIPTLIERHGNAMLMKVMSLEYVYERILKPILDVPTLKDNMLPIAQHILSVYKLICEYSEQETLISPRELQMMALLVLSHLDKHPTDNPLDTAQYYAHLIGKAVIPTHNRDFFDRQFKPTKPIIAMQPDLLASTGDYKITESRYEIFALLNDYLDLHDLRQRSPHFNKAQKFGGIGGIILDGEPGCGKTEMILAAFKKRGWQEGTHYRKIPASMHPTDMIAKIDDALNQGMYVWIDEINTIPLNERQWNNILMGLTSDGSPPIKSGGGLLAFKNPNYMAGRRALSKAIQRRTIAMPFPNLTSEEMIAILLHKKIPEDIATLLVTTYKKQRHKAEKEQLSPLPTFRDLMQAAENFMKGGDTLAKPLENLHPPKIEVIPEKECFLSYQTKIASLLTENNADKPGLFSTSLEPKQLEVLIKLSTLTHLDDLIKSANKYSHDPLIMRGKTKVMIDEILHDEHATTVLAKQPGYGHD